MPRFFVYAVELHPSAAKSRRDVEADRAGAHVYYVGQTGVSVPGRLATHLQGGHGSHHAVLRYARTLVGHEGPYRTRERAERAEREEARRIRGLGHVVLGGH